MRKQGGLSSQTVPRAVNTQGPFAGLRESLAPAHLCHIPFLAPQPLRGGPSQCATASTDGGGASQPWVSVVRQAKAWQGGEEDQVLQVCQTAEQSHRQGEASSAGHGSAHPFSITGPTSQSISKSQCGGSAHQGAVRSLGEFLKQTGWPCRVRGDPP